MEYCHIHGCNHDTDTEPTCCECYQELSNKVDALTTRIAAKRQAMSFSAMSDDFYHTNGKRRADLQTLKELQAELAAAERALDAMPI